MILLFPCPSSLWGMLLWWILRGLERFVSVCARHHVRTCERPPVETRPRFRKKTHGASLVLSWVPVL